MSIKDCWVDYVDDGLCTFHCECGKIHSAIEMGVNFKCKYCKETFKIDNGIRIERIVFSKLLEDTQSKSKEVKE